MRRGLHVLHRNACRLVQLLPERLGIPGRDDERQLLLVLERLADRRDQLQVKRRGDDRQGCEEDEADKFAVPVNARWRNTAGEGQDTLLDAAHVRKG